jgi:hypothetical protein
MATAETSPAPASTVLGLTPAMAELQALRKSGKTAKEKRAAAEKLLTTLPEKHSVAREHLLLEVVRRKLHDEPKWVTLTTRFRGHVAEIEVSADALKLHGVRFDLTADGAQQVADMLGTILPTPYVLELIWEQAEIKLKPCTLPADAKMSNTTRMVRHSRCVDQSIGGRTGLVANVGKHWVLSNRILERRGAAANFGWFRHGRRPIQTVGTVHDRGHTDYSQVVRLVKSTVRVNGHPMHMREVGGSHELWGLVSDEGPLRIFRATPHHSERLKRPKQKTAAPPKRAQASDVAATLSAKGFPLTPEQLPAGTEGLRQQRLQAEVATELRMAASTLPPEAILSYAAGFCGVRDVFFELLNDVPIDAKELARDKQIIKDGLACGGRLVKGIEGGLSKFEVDYRASGTPSMFALFPFAAGKTLESSQFAPLSPTPKGVFAAACRDDRGAARGNCEDGARARILLELKGGVLGAYETAAPKLLEGLTSKGKVDPAVRELHALFTELADADDLMVERGRHCAATLTRSLTGLPILPQTHAALAATLAKHATLCASARTGGHGKATWKFVYRARDAKGLASIKQALTVRMGQLAVESSYPENLGAAERQHAGALRSARKRALNESKIETRGTELRVTQVVAASSVERRGMAAFDGQRKQRAGAAARVIRALRAGEAPKADDLSAAASPR